ncbi:MULTISPECIES: tRNA (guanosine(46)-N7)-methyltransferase TrmB [Amycolatopsis]|uniref:tRNA (guanine-N(7)-)-methyltransferase n=1 Tax=Amycolatopsis thermoflava TaxID=84480 RepID=A0A3N2GY69_9PSEU|nr:tRNA (guanosine(46)-N7)-methyltransferase TrmB [Amycolatopsis thermoflava]ROS41160.1 tRNA (guanine-N(7)-)-methyltransferase [Amycolatopsis thermoflava]
MESEQQPRLRSVVSYVQRGGRMTVGQQRAWERQWADIGRRVADLPPGPIDFAGWFGRPAPVLLEIGSGMGETTAQLAAAEPEVNYVAVEVYEAGLGQLMLRAERLGLENLRLLHGDAVIALKEHIEPDSLSGVRIFFPDPWPKKRHHKRRLVQPDFVKLVASRLAPGGILHMATDWEHYAEQMLEVCSAEPALRNRFDDWAPRPSWRPVTKFEQRADQEGRISRDLIFERVG